MSPSFISAREIALGVRTGEWSARQIVDEHLAFIEANDGAIHAFLHVAADGARAAADAVDARVAAGEDPGPLAGVPVALKDNMCTRGVPTTHRAPSTCRAGCGWDRTPSSRSSCPWRTRRGSSSRRRPRRPP